MVADNPHVPIPPPRRAATARIQSLPKQPPHSIEAEQSVLGGLLLNNRLLDEIQDDVSADDFYRADHQLVFTAITKLINAGKPCDFVTCTEYLRIRNQVDEAGGPAYLASLAVDTYSIQNVLAYAKIVRERAIYRGLIAAGSDIGDLGYRPDGREPNDLVEEAERKVHALRQRARGQAATSNADEIDAIEAHLERALKGQNQITGIPTGYTELDHYLDGLHPGDLVIIAARPGMGKTTLAMNIGEYVAIDRKQPVAVFSMEMSRRALLRRMIASYGRIDAMDLRAGRLNDIQMSQWIMASSAIREAPIHIDDTGALSPVDLRSRARRLVGQHDIKLIVVDYLQLMTISNSKEKRTAVVDEISRSLKALAKELGLPIIALSQLNREVDNRTSRRPRLADLRESGQIEADADVVLFIHRDTETEDAAKKQEATIIIGKQRDGPTVDVPLEWHGDINRFDNRSNPGAP